MKKITSPGLVIFYTLFFKKFFYKYKSFSFGCDPMDGWIALEPGHLSFGILHDLRGKCLDHSLAGEYAAQMATDPPILKAKSVESVPADTMLMKSCDFLEHATLDASMEARFDE
ncbi:MAG: hypothetical protein UX58_C0008G0016 [Candidatus Wolfebacteria bacterium GW2011_GWB2_46_69]|nr:MAG: hypothetical protein UX58_C0008G0016 [Candidatus Wolfebacteria bacterium GW2011_GWB2_46_69]KKU58844.1 MAG: hypothetical protein UX83_C0011G0056 [Candidatus Wolfebacteria bacterium GW2011_GWE2_47_12]KKU65415.1 MAG: hypothetical protein UX90_C0006G0019 [Candidatus Wolfebacteria bacterium GW2011_GWD2_47_17]